jgi:hypothetical protein
VWRGSAGKDENREARDVDDPANRGDNHFFTCERAVAVKQVLLCAVALVLLGASAVRADIRTPPPPPPPPKPPTKPAPDTTAVVAGTAATAGIALAGVWLARSRRRVQPLS